MFLKSLDIRGFKSFADKTHIDFSDGITSLLGPNGCGKSNIVDAIKWVLGEQSTKTLRASKMEDVIFNGTDTREPMQYAEVSLVIDNSENLLDFDASEIEISRRVFRTGEGEYYINRKRSLLKEIKRLFFDTGVGKSAYSILEQGKIDQILSNRPEERRYIFEEAAGISKFKQDCIEAERNIEKTNDNIVTIETLLKGEKRSYDSLKSQAEKADQYKALSNKVFELTIDSSLIKIKTQMALQDEREKQIKIATDLKNTLTQSLDEYQESSAAEREKYNEATRKFYKIQGDINLNEASITAKRQYLTKLDDDYRDYLKLKNEIIVREDTIRLAIETLNNKLDETRDSVNDKREALEENTQRLATIENIVNANKERLLSNENAINSKEKAIEEYQDRIEVLSDELAMVIENLVGEIDTKMNDDYLPSKRNLAQSDLIDKYNSSIKKLKDQIEFYKTIPVLDNLRDHIISDIEKSLKYIDGIYSSFLAFQSSIPPFIDSILEPSGLLTKKRSISNEETDLRGKIEKLRNEIIDLKSQNSKMNEENEGFSETVGLISIAIAEINTDLKLTDQIIAQYNESIESKRTELDDVELEIGTANDRILRIQKGIRDTEDEIQELKNIINDLKHELNTVKAAQDEQSKKITEQDKEKEAANTRINQLINEIDSHNLFINNASIVIGNIMNNFSEKYARNLSEYQERMESELPDENLVENELSSLKDQLMNLGSNINHMASEDFKIAKERYDLYTTQLDDLNKAKANLDKVLEDIQTRSEELFINTYKEISTQFQIMFTRLFGGGKAELRLTDEENVLTSGIEIFAQPPGKKMNALTLLSGGERSMTAVALLFATYLVKPSPFCILDEIDAALDDKNVGFFLSVLEEFARTSQFIIITHNKKTVTGSQTLLGVTQAEPGVSITINYTIARIEGEAVILDEDAQRVDFDEEGSQK